MRSSYTMSIDLLIKELEAERDRGSDTVTLWGKATLIADPSNYVLIATEPQM